MESLLKTNLYILKIDVVLAKKETYATVGQKSIRTAIKLGELGVTDHDVIALCTKVTLDTIIPIIAGFYIGAKVANLDPLQSLRQTKHLLSLVTPKIIFVDISSLPVIEESLKQTNLKSKIVVFGNLEPYLSFNEFLQPRTTETDFQPAKVNINDTAVIFFSSGTTGLSKAICHSHSSFLNMIYVIQ